MVGAFDVDGVDGSRDVFPSSLGGCAGLNSASTLFSFSSSSVSIFPSSVISSVTDGTVLTSVSVSLVEIILSVMPIISMAFVLSVVMILSVGVSVVLILSVKLVVSMVGVLLWM